MTPLELLMDEIKHSDSLRTKILKNIQDTREKKMRFNVTNLIFDFKSNMVEIQDEIGVADEQTQSMRIDSFLSVIEIKG